MAKKHMIWLGKVENGISVMKFKKEIEGWGGGGGDGESSRQILLLCLKLKERAFLFHDDRNI